MAGEPRGWYAVGMNMVLASAFVLLSVLWLAARLQGALVAMRRLPDVAPDMAGHDVSAWPPAPGQG